MDKRYLKIIEKCHDCAALATSMALNANFKPDYHEKIADRLDDIQKQLHDCQQLLFKAVHHQTAGEPWSIDL